jgi:hypothetical protein
MKRRRAVALACASLALSACGTRTGLVDDPPATEPADAAMRLSADEQRAIVDATAGFSFAYLKELFLSAMLRWMKAREPGTMGAVLDGQLATLRSQMAPVAPPPTPSDRALGLARSVVGWVDQNVVGGGTNGRGGAGG